MNKTECSRRVVGYELKLLEDNSWLSLEDVHFENENPHYYWITSRERRDATLFSVDRESIFSIDDIKFILKQNGDFRLVAVWSDA